MTVIFMIRYFPIELQYPFDFLELVLDLGKTVKIPLSLKRMKQTQALKKIFPIHTRYAN
jgi:hypothetical protein